MGRAMVGDDVIVVEWDATAREWFVQPNVTQLPVRAVHKLTDLRVGEAAVVNEGRWSPRLGHWPQEWPGPLRLPIPKRVAMRLTIPAMLTNAFNVMPIATFKGDRVGWRGEWVPIWERIE